MKKAILMLFSIFLILPLAYAAKTGSVSYNQTVIVSGGGENASSSSYSLTTAVGIINGIITSASYVNNLGFFHFLLLANNQPCTAAGQCEGGFCCSNSCKSTACTTTDTGGTSGSTSSGSGGGGGGGGGVAGASNTSKPQVKTKSFRIAPESIKEFVALGASKSSIISIKNTGEEDLSFSAAIEGVKEFAFLSETGFSLKPGEEKALELNIIGKKLGSYLGQALIKSGDIERLVNIIVEVESESVLFDAKIDIPSAYREVEAGGEIKTQITLLNVGPPRKVDVTTTYIIKDRTGRVIYESSETFAVEKQTSYSKSFKIPSNLEPGDYLAIVELRYEKSFAVSSELFTVTGEKMGINLVKSNQTMAILVALLVGGLLLIAYLLIPGKTMLEKIIKRK